MAVVMVMHIQVMAFTVAMEVANHVSILPAMLRFHHFLVWIHLDISISFPTKRFLMYSSLLWKGRAHFMIT